MFRRVVSIQKTQPLVNLSRLGPYYNGMMQRLAAEHVQTGSKTDFETFAIERLWPVLFKTALAPEARLAARLRLMHFGDGTQSHAGYDLKVIQTPEGFSAVEATTNLPIHLFMGESFKTFKDESSLVTALSKWTSQMKVGARLTGPDGLEKFLVHTPSIKSMMFGGHPITVMDRTQLAAHLEGEHALLLYGRECLIANGDGLQSLEDSNHAILSRCRPETNGGDFKMASFTWSEKGLLLNGRSIDSLAKGPHTFKDLLGSLTEETGVIAINGQTFELSQEGVASFSRALSLYSRPLNSITKEECLAAMEKTLNPKKADAVSLDMPPSKVSKQATKPEPWSPLAKLALALVAIGAVSLAVYLLFFCGVGAGQPSAQKSSDRFRRSGDECQQSDRCNANYDGDFTRANATLHSLLPLTQDGGCDVSGLSSEEAVFKELNNVLFVRQGLGAVCPDDYLVDQPPGFCDGVLPLDCEMPEGGMETLLSQLQANGLMTEEQARQLPFCGNASSVPQQQLSDQEQYSILARLIVSNGGSPDCVVQTTQRSSTPRRPTQGPSTAKPISTTRGVATSEDPLTSAPSTTFRPDSRSTKANVPVITGSVVGGLTFLVLIAILIRCSTGRTQVEPVFRAHAI